MREMIFDGQVVPARFTVHEEFSPDFMPAPDTAIPMVAWLRLREAGVPLEGVGVVVRGDEDITPLQARLHELPVVALILPRFADGRIYSHAVRLRRLWGYTGTILVTGDVLRDQLLYLARSGVNAFVMREDQDLHASLAAFSLYTEHYQYA